MPLLVLAYVMRAVGDYFRCVLYIHNLPGRDAMLNWLGAGLCISGYLFLIPPMGTRGAALATVIAFVFVALVGFRWAQRLSPFELEWRRLLIIGVASATVLAARFALPYHTFYTELVVVPILLIVYVLLLVVFQFPSASEKRLVYARLRPIWSGSQGSA